MTSALKFLSPVMIDKIAAAKTKQDGKPKPKRKRAKVAKVRKVAAVPPAVKRPAVKRTPGEFARHQPATQKARGIGLLANVFAGMPTATGDRSNRGHNYLQCEEARALIPYDMPVSYGDSFARERYFARPCPRTPRHGFVGSRPVKSIEEVLCLWRDAVEVDPLAEVMLMRRLTGAYSAVATDAGVTYGVGHDGVTGHSAKLWNVPGPQDALRNYVNQSYAVPTKFEGVYIEAVEAHGDMRLVQMRDGPAQQSGVVDYVPEYTYRIKYLVDGRPWKDDLVGWEKHLNARVEALGKGGAVFAPGFSLASHVCVHGVALGMAVLCDVAAWGVPESYEEVHINSMYAGYHLTRTSGTPSTLNRHEYAALAEYIKSLDHYSFGKQPCTGYAPYAAHAGTGWHALTLDNSFCHSHAALATSLGVLHAQAYWGGDAHLLRLRAFGVVTMAKHLAAACLGEARHFYKAGPGYRQSATSSINWSTLLSSGEMEVSRRDPPRSREYVYCHALYMTLAKLRKVMPNCVEDFGGDWGQEDGESSNERREGSSGSDVECGYGGPLWEKSARTALSLLLAIQRFLQAPGSSAWGEVISIYNVAVNASHNNGKLLDKWLGHSMVYNIASQAPQLCFLNSIAMRVIVGDHTAGDARAHACLGEWTANVNPAPQVFLATEPRQYGTTVYHEALREWLEKHDVWAPGP